MMLAQFPRAADGDGDVRHCLAGELLKVMQNIESFRKNNYCHRFGLLYITNANTQCGQITNLPEQDSSSSSVLPSHCCLPLSSPDGHYPDGLCHSTGMRKYPDYC